MTLGRAPEQGDVWQTTAKYCEGKLSPTSIYGLLHRECHRLFPDDSFADLFRDVGRRLVPQRIVAVVMVRQRLEGLQDREAVDRVPLRRGAHKDVEADKASRTTPLPLLPRRHRFRVLYAAEIWPFAVQTDVCWRYAAMDGE